jgi:hypothetical protein
VSNLPLARLAPNAAGRGFSLDRAASIRSPGAMPQPKLRARPREVDEFNPPAVSAPAACLPASSAWLLRPLRGDRAFRQRTGALVEQFRKELPAVLKEAAKLEEKPTAAVAGR